MLVVKIKKQKGTKKFDIKRKFKFEDDKTYNTRNHISRDTSPIIGQRKWLCRAYLKEIYGRGRKPEQERFIGGIVMNFHKFH